MEVRNRQLIIIHTQKKIIWKGGKRNAEVEE